MAPLVRLILSSHCMNIADQIGLVAVPIVAALIFNASPATIGVLVACQTAAHLLGSLPFGLVVDQIQLRTTILISTLLAIAGFVAAAFAMTFGHTAIFGLAIAVAGLGNVLYGLSTLSISPKIVPACELNVANARLSLPKSIASLFVPLALGAFLVPETALQVFWIAALGATAAFFCLWGMPDIERMKRAKQSIFGQLFDGGSFVIKHDLLLPIALCAMFWNLAFVILLVLMVPVIIQIYGAHPSLFAGAMAAFGLAAISGTWVISHVSSYVSPNCILLFGPGSSIVAAALLLGVPAQNPEIVLNVAFFILGFGPSMWLVAQTTIRQLVTPENLLGRVNAVLQTTIYGVRPLGALIGGLTASWISPATGLWLVAGLFTLSFVSALASRLRTLRSYAQLGRLSFDRFG